MPLEAKQLDSTIEIGTPENIAFRYQVAGPFRRLPAFLIDVAIRLLGMVVAGWIMALLGIVFQGVMIMVMFITAFAVYWFYDAVFEIWWSGQTPGKRLLGLRVLSSDGQPVTPTQAFLRNILRWADILPLIPLSYTPLELVFPGLPLTPMCPTFLLGLFAAACNDRYQRLGDLAAGTMVVVEDKAWLMPTGKLDDPRAMSLADYIPATFVVSRTLGQALAIYVERRQFFSIPRRREIARHLGDPLLARFGMAPDTSCDLLLMALYYRTFLQDRPGEVGGEHGVYGVRPIGVLPNATAPKPDDGIVFVSSSGV
jgi:uncharacterized RDD family membrane protein YckC